MNVVLAEICAGIFAHAGLRIPSAVFAERERKQQPERDTNPQSSDPV